MQGLFSMKISVIINTYNAEKHLATVLETAKDFDEVVICDMHSSDRTIAIAEQYGCKIVYCERYPYVEPARNFAIAQAQYPWVLVIDADETVPAKLREYLYQITEDPAIGGVYIPFKNYFIDQYMRSAYPDFKLRFFKKEGADWPKEIHSTVKVQGKVIKIPRHRTDLASEHLANDSVTTIVSIGWGKLLFSPFFWFIKYYFIKKGCLDGKRGFIFAVLKAQYKFSCLAKIYENEYKKYKGK